MIVAGIGCRRGCPAAEIVALVGRAGAVDAIAAPEWKQDEPGLLEAAGSLGLPVWFVGKDALAAVQHRCPTRSAAVEAATGLGSVAEAAALAGGGVLARARFGSGWATCAVAADVPSPLPLREGVGGGVFTPPKLGACGLPLTPTLSLKGRGSRR
jgi:cobalt-precorrin 5A hydrolase